MPELGYLHPQVVHFVIALAFVGVGARLASLLPLGPRFAFAGPMGALLIVFAAGASVLAEKSGDKAHGPVERVPGARTAVTEHEDAGKLARNALLAVAALELLALALSGKAKVAKGLQVASAVAGLAACGAVFKAGDRGGDLVYNYAGGVGIRSGDSADVRHLLIAGLYHNTITARAAGQKADASRYVQELVRQMPGDTTVRFMGIESRLRDDGNPRAALDLLRALAIPESNLRLYTRQEMLIAEAYGAAGVRDSVRLTLEALRPRVAANARSVAAIDTALAKLR